MAEAPVLAEGSWLRAERQTGGKGRLGRAWISPPGNLYASTIVRLGISDPAAPGLALVTGVATHDAVSDWIGAQTPALRLKWPNDLLYDGSKIAGMLLERSGDAVVIGFGINLASSPDLPDRATASVRDITGVAPEPGLFLQGLVRQVAIWLAVWRREGLEPVRRAWLERAHPIGTALAVGDVSGRRQGLFAGLDGSGALCLRLADGSVEIVHAGDVFLI